jgi:HK97 family phage major capsid protein
MTAHPAQARLKELCDEVARRVLAGTDTKAFMDKVEAEAEKLEIQIKNHRAALRLAGASSPEEYGRANVNPGDDFGPSWAHPSSKSVIDHPMEQKAAEHGLAARKHIGPSPFHMSGKQMRDLYSAGRSNMSYGFTIGKGGDTNMGLVDKTVSEGAVGSLLPPILLPSAFQLRLEPVRIAEYFPAINAEGQAIQFLQHSGNTLAASGAGMSVAENAVKPTLGMTLTPQTVPFTVVAAIETISKQLWTDFESVATFLPAEISRQVIQGENYQILSGSGTAPDQTGLLNVSGIQTRAFTTGGSDTEIDTILEAANDVRVGTAYADADFGYFESHGLAESAAHQDEF